MAQGRYKHILLPNAPDSLKYSSTSSGGGEKPVVDRDRKQHGELLQAKLASEWQSAEHEMAVSHSTRKGVYLEFISDPGAELVTKSLEDMRTKKVRLLNVRHSQVKVMEDGRELLKDITLATVYVANEKKQYFVQKLTEYLTSETLAGNPKNLGLINSIADIRKALLVESFWCDDNTLIPGESPSWVEVWLSTEEEALIQDFESLLERLNIPQKMQRLIFPERAVKLICATRQQLESLTEQSDHIAEYKAAKTTADFFISQANYDQAEWVQELQKRVEIPEDVSSSVCILDTGVNYQHPLLQLVINQDSCSAFDLDWGVEDHNSHGTLMAGLATYGCLDSVLTHTSKIDIPFRLESIKILPPPPDSNAPNMWGAITEQAVYKAITIDGAKNRTFCMAVTAQDTRDRGRPTSWSATIDKVASEAGLEQLFVISVGNVTADLRVAGLEYPHAQITDSVHDPAQAWNAISVGAYTEKTNLTAPSLSGYAPVASLNQLSPFSTTSAEWEENKWPLKPELVLEGGNLAADHSMGFVTECNDLSLTSTWYKPHEAHFNSFNMTSASTAQLGHMCGVLRAEYPHYWEETIRALLIHSAEWPNELKNQFIDSNSKADLNYLLKLVGYGVPNLEKARYSANNILNLIAQAEIQPFDKHPSQSRYISNEMHFYELPWPVEVLQDLPLEARVKMKVTLSYFIEPGPGEIGWKDRYRYASHGLRFEVNAPDESKDEFVKRINKAAREENEQLDNSSTSGFWLLGKQARDRGSIHSDTWQGTAAELAASNQIAVMPTIGWWKERHHLGRWNSKTRYALIISIETDDSEVDIYTPVAVEVGIAPEVVVTV